MNSEVGKSFFLEWGQGFLGMELPRNFDLLMFGTDDYLSF